MCSDSDDDRRCTRFTVTGPTFGPFPSFIKKCASDALPPFTFRNLLYFSSLHSSLIIVLKASLKWTPFVGPAMQIFRFIFMKRSWLQDRINLGKRLAKLGHRAGRTFDPLVLLICKSAAYFGDQAYAAFFEKSRRAPSSRPKLDFQAQSTLLKWAYQTASTFSRRDRQEFCSAYGPFFLVYRH